MNSEIDLETVHRADAVSAGEDANLNGEADVGSAAKVAPFDDMDAGQSAP